MNPRVLAYQLGMLVQVPGLLALGSLPVCWLAGESFALGGFAATALVSLSIGAALVRSFRAAGEPSPRDAMIIAALAWLVVPLLAALPLAIVARSAGAVAAFPEAAVFADPLNALFEAFSGFTSTGLTMSARAEALPRSLQWWRSLMQWTGGLGVVVLMLAVVGPVGRAHHLYRAEAREERILPTVRSTVRTYLGIYLAWTLTGVALLWLAGAPAWEALNHGLTAIATGGFAVTERGHAFAPAVQGVMMALMIAGAVSFGAYGRALWQRHPRPLWQDGQHRLLIGLLLAGVALLLLENRTSSGAWRPWESAFQAVSALCTAGFQTAELGTWSEGAKLLIVIGMTFGGAAGSTAGGLKLARIHLLARGVLWRFRSASLQRHEVMRYELDGHGLPAEDAIRGVEAAAVLAVAWLAFLAIGSLVLLHLAPGEATLGDVLLEVASAQSNVGLSTGITGSSLPVAAKLVLMGHMWIGRLEILPVLILLMPTLRPGRRRRPDGSLQGLRARSRGGLARVLNAEAADRRVEPDPSREGAGPERGRPAPKGRPGTMMRDERDEREARRYPMRRTIAITVPSLLLAVGLAGPAAGGDLPEEQRKGDIAFLSGGVGDREQDAIRERMDDYKLALTLSRARDGSYLANVHLRLQDASGKEVLETTTRGPVFLAKLPAGRYTVSAQLAGHATESRVVDVPEKGQVRMSMALAEKTG